MDYWILTTLSISTWIEVTQELWQVSEYLQAYKIVSSNNFHLVNKYSIKRPNESWVLPFDLQAWNNYNYETNMNYNGG